jgi:hypothetical protein
MALVARILGVSLLTSALVAGLGLALLSLVPGPDATRVEQGVLFHERTPMPLGVYIVAAFILACVGGVMGAVAGAAREIVSAQRQKASNWTDVHNKTNRSDINDL